MVPGVVVTAPYHAMPTSESPGPAPVSPSSKQGLSRALIALDPQPLFLQEVYGSRQQA